MAGAIDIFVAYQFVKMLTTDWKDTDAYNLGIIDENGNLLKKQRELKTREEKKAYTVFHRLVWNIKRLLEKLPASRTKIASFAAGLWLLKEYAEQNMGMEDFAPTLVEMNNILVEHRMDIEMTPNDLFESEIEDDKDTTILPKGYYVLRNDVDTPIKPARAGTRLYVPSNVEAFDEIAGYPVFRVKHPMDGTDLIVSFSDLVREEDA